MSDPDPPGLSEADEPTEQLVLFRLAGQRFALKGHHVSEILSGDQSVYFVPGAGDYVEGVIHRRGRIESVMTLHTLLGLHPAGAGGMVLFVNAASIRTGVRIEALEDVCEVKVSALKTPSRAQAEALAPFVCALIESALHETIHVLDADALLSALQSAQRPPGPDRASGAAFAP
ncbi:chemotaxis protein CheW [Vreelandella sp. EE7]